MHWCTFGTSSAGKAWRRTPALLMARTDYTNAREQFTSKQPESNWNCELRLLIVYDFQIIRPNVNIFYRMWSHNIKPQTTHAWKING